MCAARTTRAIRGSERPAIAQLTVPTLAGLLQSTSMPSQCGWSLLADSVATRKGLGGQPSDRYGRKLGREAQYFVHRKRPSPSFPAARNDSVPGPSLLF